MMPRLRDSWLPAVSKADFLVFVVVRHAPRHRSACSFYGLSSAACLAVQDSSQADLLPLARESLDAAVELCAYPCACVCVCQCDCMTGGMLVSRWLPCWSVDSLPLHTVCITGPTGCPPVLVLATKVDLMSSLSVLDVVEELDMRSFEDAYWAVEVRCTRSRVAIA